MIRVISAAGSKADVMETLRALEVGSGESTMARVLKALAEHVETSVDSGNKHVEVSLSIGTRFNEG